LFLVIEQQFFEQQLFVIVMVVGFGKQQFFKFIKNAHPYGNQPTCGWCVFAG